MGDYCVCEKCGCKYLVWEKCCPYCRKLAELKAQLTSSRAELTALREAVQALVNNVRRGTPIDIPAIETQLALADDVAALLEVSDE